MKKSLIIITEGDMQEMIDFTSCPIDLIANYGGSDQKRGIIYQGERYMLKMLSCLTGKRERYQE